MGKRTRSRRTSQRTTSFGSLLRATPNHVDHGKMARFFGSMAGRAAGMRKALFTNGPGIKTLASAGVGCVGLQLNFGTHALAQSRTEPKELKTKFSYEGWKQDAEIAEERDIKYPEHPICAWAVLDTMLRKQQVHDGDRSHPFIRKLDALTPTLSYAGWEDDAKKIEWPNASKAPSGGISAAPLFFYLPQPWLARAEDGGITREYFSARRARLKSYTGIARLASSSSSIIPLRWTPRRCAYQFIEEDVDSALARMRLEQAEHDARMRLEQAKHEIHTESSDAKQRRLNDNVIRLEQKLSSWLA